MRLGCLRRSRAAVRLAAITKAWRCAVECQPTAISCSLERQAAQTCAKARTDCCKNGVGQPKDAAMVVQLFEKGCEFGNADACVDVGNRHRGSFGVERDPCHTQSYYDTRSSSTMIRIWRSRRLRQGNRSLAIKNLGRDTESPAHNSKFLRDIDQASQKRNPSEVTPRTATLSPHMPKNQPSRTNRARISDPPHHRPFRETANGPRQCTGKHDIDQE